MVRPFRLLCVGLLALFCSCIQAQNTRNGINIPFQPCQDVHQPHMKIQNVTFNPYPLEIGHANNMWITGSLNTKLASATVDWAAYFQGILLANETDSACGAGWFECPRGPGFANITSSVYLPSSVATGLLNVKMHARDQDMADIFCFTVDIQISAGNRARPSSLRPETAELPLGVRPLVIPGQSRV